ncbi:MAG: class I SAM-dependent methyltransferase [Candidatus Dormibacteria bacterium]
MAATSGTDAEAQTDPGRDPDLAGAIRLPPAVISGPLLTAARAARGFLPDDEAMVLHRAAVAAATRGPLLEVGGYCGKSAVYLGAAARHHGTLLFSVDHHRGSEENQPGELYCDPAVVDLRTGAVDTLPHFRRTIADAGLEAWVVAVVGGSAAVAAHWRTPLALVFIDGGHTDAAAQADYEGWSPLLLPGGLLVIHDVFPNPEDGGQAPLHIYRRALASARFTEVAARGSLRVLRSLG